MDIPFDRNIHDNISQRAIASYCRGVRAFEPVVSHLPDGEQAAVACSQQNLHGFLSSLYALMYADPSRFGMPTSPDDCLSSDAQGTDRKKEVARKLTKPRTVLANTMDMLWQLGCRGRLQGDALLIGEADYREILGSQAKPRKALLAGIGEAGLEAHETADGLVLGSRRYPGMLPALHQLAECCAAREDQALAAVNFSRGDFGALLPGYNPNALNLLTYLPAEARVPAERLHAFMLTQGYRATGYISKRFAWRVEYQGPHKIKGTPLVQFDYDERHQNVLQVQLKCASTNRLLPYFAEQAPDVQDDFVHRIYRCRGAACGWCKTRKGLGPSALEYAGERVVLCWYSRPEVADLSDNALEILQGYVAWHARLA
jgi:hypothetical protein